MRTSFPDRAFQLWEYGVSHGSLLVRSPKAPGISTNVDLICVGVEYLSAPRHIQGLELVDASAEEIQRLSEILGKVIQPTRVQVIVSRDQRFPIVAVAFRVSENEDDIFSSPFEFKQ